jgi:RNA polymerase sigma factor (sigma-70 family)
MNPRLVPPSRLARLSLRMHRDDRLAELARHGSDAAFEAIVYRYRPALVRHCAQVVGHSDADEAVQEALLRAHRALIGGPPVHSLGPWLHAIAHNAALGLLRTRRAGAEYLEHDGEVYDPTEDADRIDALVAAVLSLPARQRQAIVMRELEGRSYDEIAARLGASDGAVRALLNRARASIRERLGALLPLDPVLRWLSSAISGQGGGLTLSGGGALAVKLSGAIMLSTVAPVVVATPMPLASSAPATHHAARPATRVHANLPAAHRAVTVAAARPTIRRFSAITTTTPAAPAHRVTAAASATRGCAEPPRSAAQAPPTQSGALPDGQGARTATPRNTTQIPGQPRPPGQSSGS